MTVNELRELLAAEDGDRLVVMSRDSDGTGFSPLTEVECAAYRADGSRSGETGIEALTDALREQGFGEEDVLSGAGVVPAVVLWPTN